MIDPTENLRGINVPLRSSQPGTYRTGRELEAIGTSIARDGYTIKLYGDKGSADGQRNFDLGELESLKKRLTMLEAAVEDYRKLLDARWS